MKNQYSLHNFWIFIMIKNRVECWANAGIVFLCMTNIALYIYKVLFGIFTSIVLYIIRITMYMYITSIVLHIYRMTCWSTW